MTSALTSLLTPPTRSDAHNKRAGSQSSSGASLAERARAFNDPRARWGRARDGARDGQADRLPSADSSRADRGHAVGPRGHPMTEVWTSSWSSAAGARVGARDRQTVSAAPQAVCGAAHSPASVVQSLALGARARRASVRPLATASFALASSTRAYRITTKVQAP
jgi:hypothetical protein